MLLVMAASLGFYGVKAGIFVIMSGGNYMVMGAPGNTFVSSNNAIDTPIFVARADDDISAVRAAARMYFFMLFLLRFECPATPENWPELFLRRGNGKHSAMRSAPETGA